MSRLSNAAGLVLGVTLAIAPHAANAQNWQQILRDAARAGGGSTPPSAAARAAQRERVQAEAARQREAIYQRSMGNSLQPQTPGVTGFGGNREDRQASTRFSGSCNSPVELRWKVYKDEPLSVDSLREVSLPKVVYLIGPAISNCATVPLVVYGPAGGQIGRDVLIRRIFQSYPTVDYAWSSEAAIKAALAVLSLPDEDPTFDAAHREAVATTAAILGEIVGENERVCQVQYDAAMQKQRQEFEQRRRAANGAPMFVGGEDVNGQAHTACKKEAGALNVALGAKVTGNARAFAMRQPVSYDGLRALRAISSEYRNSNAEAVIQNRVGEIERALRPQILADLNKPGGDRLLDDLFKSDRARTQAYAPYVFDPRFVARLPKRAAGERPFFMRANQQEMSQRESAQAGAFAAWGEPTAEEIAFAVMRSLRLAGGRQVTPNVVTVPSGLNRLGIGALDGMASMSMQVFDVRKNGCVRQANGYRCTYNLYARMLAGGAFGGDTMGVLGMLGASPDNWFGAQNSTLFVPSRNGWRMPQADQMIANGQAAQLVQLGNVASDIADAGSSAVGVLSNAVGQGSGGGGGGGGGGADGDSQMETERKQRVQEQQEKGRRSR